MTPTEQLEVTVVRATSVTMGADATIDANALLAELDPVWIEISRHPGELLPAVERLARTLATELANAPASARTALERYRGAVAVAKFDPVEPPREIVAFLILDALERIRESCLVRTAVATTPR